MENANCLLGKIVSWIYIEMEPYDRIAGRGMVIGVVGTEWMLVRHIPHPGDDEPDHELLININEYGLHFYESLEEEQTWFEWVTTDPKRIVKLVKKEEQE